jgi:quercetin dioxygenase-like cupin family protein
MSEFESQAHAVFAEGGPAVDVKMRRFHGDGVAALRMILPKGATTVKHYHYYSHLSVAAAGVALLRRSDTKEAIRVVAGEVVEIPPKVEHTIQALTDVVWICFHATATENAHD